MEEEDTEDCLESVSRTLENPLLVQHIFKNLDFDDLLNCRLVERGNWFNLATEILQKRYKIKIVHNFSNGLFNGKFSQAYEDPSENPWSLTSLKSAIKGANPPLCTHFRFHGGFFEDQDLLNFFRSCGHFVVELEIDLVTRTYVNHVIEKFRIILFKYLPNLESLTIWQVSLGWNTSTRIFSNSIGPNTKLPKLKFFTFVESLDIPEYRFIQDIQTAAINLNQVQKIPLVPLPVSRTQYFVCGDTSFMCLIFVPLKCYMRFYEKLLRTKMKYSKITVDLKSIGIQESRGLSQASTILTEILTHSQSTLRVLDGVVDVACLIGNKLNQLKFPNVTYIHLEATKGPFPQNKQNIIPSLSTISQSFPYLVHIGIESVEFLEGCCQQQPFESLNGLIIDKYFCNAENCKMVTHIFPTLQRLTLRNMKNFKNAADGIWDNFTHIPHLELEVLLDDVDKQDILIEKYFMGIHNTSSSILKLDALKTLQLTITPIPNERENGRKGRWNNWKFFGPQFFSTLDNKLDNLEKVDLFIDARNTCTKSENKIHKHLRKIKNFRKLMVIPLMEYG